MKKEIKYGLKHKKGLNLMFSIFVLVIAGMLGGFSYLIKDAIPPENLWKMYLFFGGIGGGIIVFSFKMILYDSYYQSYHMQQYKVDIYAPDEKTLVETSEIEAWSWISAATQARRKLDLYYKIEPLGRKEKNE